MSILTRIIAAFCLVIVIGAVQSSLTVYKMTNLADQINLEAELPTTLVDAAHSAWDSFRDARDYLAEFGAKTTFRDSKASIAEFRKLTSKVEAQLARLQQNATGGDVAAKIKLAEAQFANWQSSALIVMGASPATLVPVPHVLAKREDMVRQAIHDLVTTAIREAGAARVHMVADATMTRTWTIYLALAGAIVGLGLAIASALSITKPLRRGIGAMNRLASGDADVALAGQDRKDEIGDMVRSVIVFKENLLERRRLEQTERETAQRELSRQKQLEQQLLKFRTEITAVVEKLAKQVGNLTGTAQSLTTATGSTSAEAYVAV